MPFSVCLSTFFFRCALLVVDERTADDVISVDIAGARVTCEMGPVRRGSFWAWSGNWLIEKKSTDKKTVMFAVCLLRNEQNNVKKKKQF